MRLKLEETVKCGVEIADWLHTCWELREKGITLHPDPGYPRNDVLTRGIVTAVILAYENQLERELRQFYGYHAERNGLGHFEEPYERPFAHVFVPDTPTKLVPTAFDTLSYPQQLAIVQGIDRICQSHRQDDAALPVSTYTDGMYDPAYDAPINEGYIAALAEQGIIIRAIPAGDAPDWPGEPEDYYR